MSHIWMATLKPDGTPLKHKHIIKTHFIWNPQENCTKCKVTRCGACDPHGRIRDSECGKET